MLVFIAFIMIIIIYAFVGTSEDKGKIRKDEDRIVEYIKEKVELQNNEEIRKIEFVKYEKNLSTGIWDYEVIINDKIKLTFTAWREREEVRLSYYDDEDINILRSINTQWMLNRINDVLVLQNGIRNYRIR